MDEVTMDDGLDGPETLAFGLGVPETATLVVTLLAAWACLAALPALVAWPAAVVLVAAGAVLGWVKVDDRTLLGWGVDAAGFGWRRRHTLGLRWQARTAGLSTSIRARVRRAPMDVAGGAVVLPLTLPRARPATVTSAARLVGFFSFRGGSGRTALACAVAARLATVGRLPGGLGWRRLRVALVDLDDMLPAASLRWGAAIDGPPRLHVSGAVIHPAPGRDGSQLHRVRAVAAGADVVVVDARWHEPGGVDLLSRCDDIVVVVERTQAGVLDGYRSVAWLRRLGLRDRLVLVGNRTDDIAGLGDLAGDLGIPVTACVPVSADVEREPAVESLTALLNRRLMDGRAGGAEPRGVDVEAG